jgi:2,3-bisphosphoglycerate-dependent phosphoglycerate mutase
MERTIPYCKNVIVPSSLDKGQSVLIASSENAIRGLLMHLCDIPTDRIHEVEIPTGLPMVYDAQARRIRLLGDEDVPNPLDKFDFGAAPELFVNNDQVRQFREGKA